MHIIKDKPLNCLLTHDEALDMIKTVIGVNHTLLRDSSSSNFVKVRDAVAEIIVERLTSKRTKKFYNSLKDTEEK